VCRALHSDARSKHNSGNDALYGLQCLLLMFTTWKAKRHRDEEFEIERHRKADEVEGSLWEQRLEDLTALARKDRDLRRAAHVAWRNVVHEKRDKPVQEDWLDISKCDSGLMEMFS
jgi:hypothetical protein